MAFSSGTYSLYTPGNPVVSGTSISSTAFNNTMNDIATALSTCLLKDGTQTVTANIPMAGFKFTGLGAGSASGNSIRYEQVNGVVTTAGDLLQATGAGAFTRVAFGTKGDVLAGAGAGVGVALAVGANGKALIADSNQTNGVGYAYPAIRSYLAGCTLTTAGGSTTMSVAAGSATDGTNVDMMVLSAIGKTTSAWAVGTGNGGLDTGAIGASTWYHFYVIKRVDTGVVDVLISLSASAPTMPTSYTLKRRIGSGKTDGSSNWTAFVQDGDTFQWLAIVADVNSNNPGTAAVSRTLTVPTGVRVKAIMNAGLVLTTTAGVYYGLLADLSTTDTAPAAGNANLSGFVDTATDSASYFSQLQIFTNTSAQIRSRLGTSSAATTLDINTTGWIDRRGQDS